jgi:hypothetical protein
MVLLSSITGSAPVDIAGWLACAFFMLGLWNGLKKAINNEKEKPAPSQTYTTKADSEKHVSENRAQHAVLFSKIAEAERLLRLEMKADTTDLHNKVNAVAREVSGLTAATEAQTNQLTRIEGLVAGKKH